MLIVGEDENVFSIAPLVDTSVKAQIRCDRDEVRYFKESMYFGIHCSTCCTGDSCAAFKMELEDI